MCRYRHKYKRELCIRYCGSYRDWNHLHLLHEVRFNKFLEHAEGTQFSNNKLQLFLKCHNCHSGGRNVCIQGIVYAYFYRKRTACIISHCKYGCRHIIRSLLNFDDLDLSIIILHSTVQVSKFEQGPTPSHIYPVKKTNLLLGSG